MDQIETSLGPLHIERYGAGPSLVCWPSLFCDVRTLRPLVDEFARDHQVLLVDGPGHGRSGGVARAFTMEETAAAAMQVLDAVGIARATWIGSAWGGHVGTVAALGYPQRVRALVTMNAPFGAWSGRNRVMNAMLYWSFRLLGRPRMLARTVAEMMIAPARRAARPGLVEPVVDCMVSSDRRAFFAAVRSAMLLRPSLIPRLPEVRVPTLFVTGAQDELFPVELARTQAQAIPGARFEVVPGSSHLSVWEAPEVVLPMLRSFITSVERDEIASSARGAPDRTSTATAGPTSP